MTPQALTPPRLSLIGLFLIFLRFGFTAFGGPVAQIAMIRRELIERRGWIDGARFNRLLAVMQALPGPEAHELCVHMGMVARGRLGGLLAGLGFMLPGLALMLLAAWAYQAWIAGQAALAGVLLGVQVVVLAVITRAVERIGRHVLAGPLSWGLAAGAAALTLIGAPFWIPLAAAGLLAVTRRLAARLLTVAAAGAVTAAALLLFPTTGPGIVSVASGPATVAALFLAGLKGGLLTFGGAYTAIPYVRADTVGRGWLSEGAFLDGVGLASALPTPLIIFGTFAGWMAGGWAGALAMTAGLFLPAFAFSMFFFERLEAIIDNPALHRLLDGVAAAVVGVIAATLLQLGVALTQRLPAVAAGGVLFAIALILVWRLRGGWVTPALMMGGGLAGYLVFRAV